MATLRDIRTRIASVKSTKQITNAMKMVSAAKLRRATEAAMSARPWQETLTATLQRVASGSGEIEHPLLESHGSVKNVLLVVVSTDRGLCGGFNGTLLRQTEVWLKAQQAMVVHSGGHAEGDVRKVRVRTFGKKSREFFKSRSYPVEESRIDVTPAVFMAEVQALADIMVAGFSLPADDPGRYDEVYVAYNQFKNTLTQIPTFVRVLPLSIDVAADDNAACAGADYVYEPKGAAILNTLLPLYLRTLLLQCFLETGAGEQAARMTAMDNATRNATELIKSLTLDYNRGRQAAITKELIEIVSGAEAL